MNAVVSFFPITWSGLQRHCRRAWLEDHRGETPRRRPDLPAGDVPLSIAICMQLSATQRFATEREAETFRYVSPRAQNAVMYWQFAGDAREQVRVMAGCVKYWRKRSAAQADLDRGELRTRWKAYRAMMRRQAGCVGWVRGQLTVLPLVRMAALQAAE